MSAMTAPVFAELREASSPSRRTARPSDLVYLSRQTLGERELEVELLGLFERQAALIVRQIDLASNSRSRQDLAHTLKGSARAVGAGAVAEAAEAYESCLATAAGEQRVADAREALRVAVAEARAEVAALLADAKA